MLFKNNYKNFNSSWMNKIDSGENPNSQDLLDHLHTIHNRHAGFTEKIATSCCDSNGKNSYELLIDTIDPNSHIDILDLACGSGVLLEYCNKRFPFNVKLSGVDMNDNELKLARTRLYDQDVDFYNAKAQKLNFIKDASKDVFFPKKLFKLYRYFCPGPITFILKKKKYSNLNKLTTAGLDSVAVRFPKHKVLRKILKKINYPSVTLTKRFVAYVGTYFNSIFDTYADTHFDTNL